MQDVEKTIEAYLGLAVSIMRRPGDTEAGFRLHKERGQFRDEGALGRSVIYKLRTYFFRGACCREAGSGGLVLVIKTKGLDLA